MGVTRRIPRHQFVRCRDDTCPILQKSVYEIVMESKRGKKKSSSSSSLFYEAPLGYRLTSDFVLTLFIFIGWADQETQCMWQKASLMEACDIMHNQRDKIRQFKAVNNEFLCERNYVHEGSNASGDTPRDFDDNKKLQFKVLKAA
ncbi:hypothetical protein YC2023_059736 [Brassica napus]